jgi:transcriptional regulator with XRE-family HTH domain
VKDLRKRRGWSAQRLGEEMTRVGVAWDRSIVANFENGRRSYVTVEELLALAYVFSVAPVHMIVPPQSRQELTPASKDDLSQLLRQAPYAYAITPTVQYAPTIAVRGWIRGERTIGAVDPRLYFSEVPPDEFEAKPQPDDDEISELEQYYREVELRLDEASEPRPPAEEE